VTVQWDPESRHHAADVPFILVGTKEDLRHNEDWIARLRAEGKSPKTVDDGEKLATELGAVKYVECSALMQVRLVMCRPAAAGARAVTWPLFHPAADWSEERVR